MKSILVLTCAVLFLAMLFAGCTTQAPATLPATTVPVPATTVPVPTATTPPLTDPALTGGWNLNGAMVGGGAQSGILNNKLSITFKNDGALTGFGGCNNFFGSYTLSGQTTKFGKIISIGPLGMTQMYCADTADLERTYLTLLQSAKAYSITNNKMLLTTDELNQLSFDKASP